MIETPSPAPSPAAAPREKSRWLPWIVGAALVAVAGGYFFMRRPASPAAPDAPAMSAKGPGAPGAPGKGGGSGSAGRFDPNRPTPIAAAVARHANLPVWLPALGTVTPRSTVTVRARVDGPLLAVGFKEGELVKAGQLLARIDPRPFEIALAQAQAQLARDQAQLDAAKVDLARYQELIATDSIPRQQVDSQAAQVAQLSAAIAADKSAVDNAKLQLSYTNVLAPVAGRAGLRQVDPGNLIHAGDAGGIVVITEVEPIYVTFPLPQDNLPAVLERLRSGAALPVSALDRDGSTRLARGRLLTTDNTIDPATGTIKLKAVFDNRDGALFPNQFVNVRLLLDTKENAIVVPTSAVQRGAPGTYVYVVKDDGTVTIRPVKPGPASGESTSIAEGLAPGERVVADGADKLREGARVEVIDPNAANAAPGGGAGRKGDRTRPADGGAAKQGDGAAAQSPAPSARPAR